MIFKLFYPSLLGTTSRFATNTDGVKKPPFVEQSKQIVVHWTFVTTLAGNITNRTGYLLDNDCTFVVILVNTWTVLWECTGAFLWHPHCICQLPMTRTNRFMSGVKLLLMVVRMTGGLNFSKPCWSQDHIMLIHLWIDNSTQTHFNVAPMHLLL